MGATPISPPAPGPTRSMPATRPRSTEFLNKLFANVPVFDTGGRAATTTFAEREHRRRADHLRGRSCTAIGKQFGADKYEPWCRLGQPAGRIPGRHRRQGRRRARHPRPRQGLSRFPLSRRRPGDRRRELPTACSDEAVTAAHADQLPRGRLVTVEDAVRRLGQGHRRSTSPRAACSTRSSSTSRTRPLRYRLRPAVTPAPSPLGSACSCR